MASADANPLVGQVSADEVGRVEARGIDYVPETDRHSHPRDLAWAMFGPQFGFGVHVGCGVEVPPFGVDVGVGIGGKVSALQSNG